MLSAFKNTKLMFYKILDLMCFRVFCMGNIILYFPLASIIEIKSQRNVGKNILIR